MLTVEGIRPGEERIVYSWDVPRRISGARIVFDSNMTFTGKRML